MFNLSAPKQRRTTEAGPPASSVTASRTYPTGEDYKDYDDDGDSLLAMSQDQYFNELQELDDQDEDDRKPAAQSRLIQNPKWFTPAITIQLWVSKSDSFLADDVAKSDIFLRDLVQEPMQLDTWGITSDDDGKKTSIPSDFNPLLFEKRTMPPLQKYAVFFCAYRPADPDSWKVVSRDETSKDSNSRPLRIPADKLTFPGLISAEAFENLCEAKRSANHSVALDWIATRANECRSFGPVVPKFHALFSNAVGASYLVQGKFTPIASVNDPSKCWSAIHWMQSARDHQSKIRIPNGGYSATEIRQATRNSWWFHDLLTRYVPSNRSEANMSSFSQGGLLSDKLIRLSSWIHAESEAAQIWDGLPGESKEKISAHFCVLLSKLFEIFKRWHDFHPLSRMHLIRYKFFSDNDIRNDAFILKNTTTTYRNRQESLSKDLAHWQDEFDTRFAESEILSLTLHWPANFPSVLLPDTTGSQSKQPNRNTGKVGKADSHETDRPSSSSNKQRGKDHAASQLSGEYKIASKPAFRLKTDFKDPVGADFTFTDLLKEAKEKDPNFPRMPKIGRKLFCFRFMTSQCGCRPPWKRGKLTECDKFHLELGPDGNAHQVPKEVFDTLITIARAPPIKEKIDPSPELIAKGSAP